MFGSMNLVETDPGVASSSSNNTPEFMGDGEEFISSLESDSLALTTSSDSADSMP